MSFPTSIFINFTNDILVHRTNHHWEAPSWYRCCWSSCSCLWDCWTFSLPHLVGNKNQPIWVNVFNFGSGSGEGNGVIIWDEVWLFSNQLSSRVQRWLCLQVVRPRCNKGLPSVQGIPFNLLNFKNFIFLLQIFRVTLRQDFKSLYYLC